ncbi:MAG: hypothetical protein AAF916_03545 [Planctomycetota bacterium]
MKLYRHWARARVDDQGRVDPRGSFLALGWSEISEEEAAELALQRAIKFSDAFGGRKPWKREEYYVDRPPREPLEGEVEFEGRVVAGVTRNVYGARVLNAAHAIFVDMDTTPVKPRAYNATIERWIESDLVVRRASRVVERHPGMGMRLYQTAAGYRGLITTEVMSPTSSESISLLKEFRTDKLYARLCLSQETYRARLTPKPWRCGLGRPYMAYPWANDQLECKFQDWRGAYEEVIQEFATCSYVGVLGEEAVMPEIKPILELHDRETRATTRLTLA